MTTEYVDKREYLDNRYQYDSIDFKELNPFSSSFKFFIFQTKEYKRSVIGFGWKRTREPTEGKG